MKPECPDPGYNPESYDWFDILASTISPKLKHELQVNSTSTLAQIIKITKVWPESYTTWEELTKLNMG